MASLKLTDIKLRSEQMPSHFQFFFLFEIEPFIPSPEVQKDDSQICADLCVKLYGLFFHAYNLPDKSVLT